jgi:methylenetetrahydrofolate reductase (NADPH)
VQQLGADIPIVPGIMPITNYVQLTRFSKICDADIPSWILNRLEMYRDDMDSLRAFGLDVVSEMCQQMKVRGVNDFHFYTMNRSEPALSIVGNIV